MESLPEIQAGITVPSRDQQERSSWRAIPTPEWIPASYASGLAGTMLVVALLVALLGAISLLLLVIGRQQGSSQV